MKSVKASSFADLADVRAFKRCKAIGNSDQFCFGRGDNGVGFSAMPVKDDNTWVPIENDNDGRINCTDEDIPYVALPPEEWLAKWGSVKNAAGKKVRVTCNGKTVICYLGDTMPHYANIHNGCGIDLAPGAQKAFGLHAPFTVPAQWEWA